MKLTNELEFYKNNYNRLDINEESLSKLKLKLKLGDRDTMEWIIDYLKIDNFELLKHIAWTINNSNSSEVIAYRDGALWRNLHLIKFLTQFIQEKKYYDRMEQKEKVI